ncbi:MAG: hypothetical protein WCG06_00195, partial [Candidatus Omnitrophota bacterium]
MTERIQTSESPKIRTRFSPTIRWISMALILTFCATDLAWANPADLQSAFSSNLWIDPSKLRVGAEHGRVSETAKGDSPYGLVHIQDAHTNPGAQKNIVAILERLIREHGVKTVFIEGGTKDDSLAFLKPLAPEAVRRIVGEKYLLSGEINAAEYLSLVSDKSFELVGVEDGRLYDENLLRYGRLVRRRPRLLAALEKLQGRADFLASRLYPEAARSFGAFLAAFERKDKGIADYYRQVVTTASDCGQDLSDFKQLALLKRLWAAESGIDFEAANRQQRVMAERLLRQGVSLDGIAGSEGTDLSKIRSGQDPRSEADRLERLIRQARRLKHEGKLTDCRDDQIVRVIAYQRLGASVDFTALAAEMPRIERAIYVTLLKGNRRARNLYEICENVKILRELFSLNLTSDGFARWGRRSGDLYASFLNAQAFVNGALYDLGQDAQLVAYQRQIQASLRESLAFYRNQNLRDERFLERVYARLSGREPQAAALITGGYHTPNLKHLMRLKGISYAVVCPRVERPTDQARYERILMSGLAKRPIKEAATVAESMTMPQAVVERVTAPTLSNLRQDLIAYALAYSHRASNVKDSQAQSVTPMSTADFSKRVMDWINQTVRRPASENKTVSPGKGISNQELRSHPEHSAEYKLAAARMSQTGRAVISSVAAVKRSWMLTKTGLRPDAGARLSTRLYDPPFFDETQPAMKLPSRSVEPESLAADAEEPGFTGQFLRRLGFNGQNIISSKVESKPSQIVAVGLSFLDKAALLPLAMTPSYEPLEGNVIRVETPRSKGRGYVRRGYVAYRYGADRRLRVFSQVDYKGNGRSGIGLKDFGNVVNASAAEVGRTVKYTAKNDLSGEMLAMEAGLFHPSTLALAQWDKVVDPDGKVIDAADVKLKSGAPAGPFYSIGRGWEDGTRLWELTASVRSATSYATPIFVALNPMLELLYAVEYHQSIRDHARAKVDDYLDRYRSIRAKSGEAFGVGVAFRMTPQDLGLVGRTRYRAYLAAYQAQIYEQLVRTVKGGLALKPWAFHLANMSLSGEFSGFDRLMRANGDWKRVRSGLVGALLDTYGAFNCLSVALDGETISFEEFYKGFQTALKAGCAADENVKRELVAESFDQLVGRGVIRGRLDMGEAYVFSRRSVDDIEALRRAMDVFFGQLGAIYRGSVPTEYDFFDRLPTNGSGKYFYEMGESFYRQFFGGVHPEQQENYERTRSAPGLAVCHYRADALLQRLEAMARDDRTAYPRIADLVKRLSAILEANPRNAFAQVDRARA